MCGIVGVFCRQNLKRKLLEGLYILEYRGYDSAGIAFFENDKIKIEKSVGNIENLEKQFDFSEDEFVCGIGHTRWATHGEPTIENCHPHKSNDGNWVVVHNGIIENYKNLKDKLVDDGISFYSKTDTEVVANMLQKESENNINSLISVCKKLQGSWAFCCLNKNEKNTIYVAKRTSPLYVAKNENDVFVSSDILCFKGKFKKCYCLEDDEFAKIKNGKIEFYDINGLVIKKEKIDVDVQNSTEKLTEYKHFMLKEIMEIPDRISDLIYAYNKQKDKIDIFTNKVKNASQVLFIACGTAYHSGLVGEYYLKSKFEKFSQSIIASEFVLGKCFVDNKTLAIFISQSGETADTIAALKIAKQRGAFCVVVTNNTHSTIARIADMVFPIYAGSEIAVASTKAYTSQCLTLYFLFSGFNEENKLKVKSVENNLRDLYVDKLVEVANKIKDKESVFFIGRGLDYISCLEGSLKLKEITYINSYACSSGELKHGTLALIDNSSVVFCLITQKEILNKSVNSLLEVKARGAKLVVVSCFEEVEKLIASDDVFIKLLPVDEDLYAVSSIVPLQLIAFYTSVMRGYNPDKPRNLAKSVTVE